MKIPALILSVFISSSGMAQGTDMVYEKYDLTPDGKVLHSDIDLLPDGQTLAVSAAAWDGLQLVDASSMTVISEHKVGKWNGGSRIDVSKDGSHILLQQNFYMDFSPNKDREVSFEVISIETGETVLKIAKAHDAQFHPDGNRLIVLEGDEVFSYPLNGSEKRTLFPVHEASNCVAVSHDGKHIVISHHPDDGFVDDFVTKKRQKKNYKIYKKYRQCISVFDAENFERLYTVNDMFDIPYLLEFGPQDEYLLCYSVPHTKVVQKTGMKGTKYISKISRETGEVNQVGFVSNSYYEPDFEFSHSGDFIALVTVNITGHPEVWVANYHTGDVEARYEMAQRIFGGHMKGELVPDAGRVGVAFSEDDSHLFLTYGSLIVKWKIPYKS